MTPHQISVKTLLLILSVETEPHINEGKLHKQYEKPERQIISLQFVQSNQCHNIVRPKALCFLPGLEKKKSKND